jgi:hypothetical protein
MFRTIDAIKEAPDDTLADQVPYLTSVSGVKASVESIKQVFRVVDPLIPFEDQDEVWNDPSSPRSYERIYNAQIKPAEAGGVLPKGKFTARDAMIGADPYNALVKLKREYESLRKQDAKASRSPLGKQAAKHYDNRNYLDAYRMLKTAAGGST